MIEQRLHGLGSAMGSATGSAMRPALGRTIGPAMLLVVMAAAAPPTAAEIIDITWSAEGGFDRSATVPPGKFAEVCGPLRKGQSIAWSFEADQPMDFNIHYHQGKKVVFPARQNAIAKRAGTLRVGIDQDYCWMWTNKSDAQATLRMTLKR